MAKLMTDDELAKALATAEVVEEGGYSADTSGDEDDYVLATLYKLPGGRHFRHIGSSGMSSPYSGAGEIGEWLKADEVADWNEFSG